MTEERIEAHNVSLYPRDWRDVVAVAEESGVRTLSAALRIILQEWRAARAHEEARGQTHPAQQNPAPAL